MSKETAKIRKLFALGKADGYARKKCVCKLLYIFMLGYEVDFGYMEAVTLLSSEKYSEKQIGYLALGILLHENHDMIPLIINTLQQDLESKSHVCQSLALTAIGNIGGKEMAEQLTAPITKLLLAGESHTYIRKKSALCLLNMFRKYPDIVTPESMAGKFGFLLQKFDVGLLTSVMSLLLGMAAVKPQVFEGFANQAILILSKIILGKDFPRQYVYYNVSNPWLQVKLLRFLRYYPPTEDSNMLRKLYTLLDRILGSAGSAKNQSVNYKNALNCTLFEAISLVIHLESNSMLLQKAASLLGRFIQAKETNIRYLGLETMAHLALMSEEGNRLVIGHQETVQRALSATDISIRRRALDLLFGMCNNDNSQSIVTNLLEYLRSADYEIREELVIKISILAEKFAPSHSWYVDVILELLDTAGDAVNDEIWHRLVQIVTNNENAQEYAAKACFKALQNPACHETAVKVGGYILGEFGHLIADFPGTGPRDQLSVLHSKFPAVSSTTKAILFSTYVKFINLYPEELANEILSILRQHANVIDNELQQRACEYLALAQYKANPDLIGTVLEEMPVFADRLITQRADRNSRAVDEAEPTEAAEREEHPPVPPSTTASLSVDDLLGDTSSEPLLPETDYFKNLCVSAEGILHQDDFLQIGIKSQYQKQNGRVMFYYGNVTAMPLESFTAEFVASPEIKTQAQSTPEAIGAKQQIQQLLNLVCLSPFHQPPVLKLSFRSNGQSHGVSLKLPVVFTKFTEPLKLDAANFFHGWKQVTGPPYEHMEVFRAKAGNANTKFVSNVIGNGYHLSVLSDVDPNPNNIVGAGKFIGGNAQVSCLVRVEINQAAKMLRMTVRTFNAVTTAALAYLLKMQLAEPTI